MRMLISYPAMYTTLKSMKWKIRLGWVVCSLYHKWKTLAKGNFP